MDDALAERHTDLLYRIPWRQGAGQQDREVLLFVIFEHQSSVDSLMSYRMLSYAVRVWDKWLQQHPAQKLLPPIVPLVLYHGEQEWTAATELGELFDLEGVKPTAVERLRPFLPRLRIMLNEVGRIPDEELSGHGAVRLTLLLFKHGRRPEVLEHLPRWEDEFRMEVARGKPGLQNLTLLVTYRAPRNAHFTYRCTRTSWGLTGGNIAALGGGEYLPEGGREARPGSVGGWNKQSGLKCAGHTPFSYGPGYHRIYGETTKHASEASVFNHTPLDRTGWG